MQNFKEKYLSKLANDELTIFDLGSMDVNGSYREIFDNPKWHYKGLDLSEGKNVDIVLIERQMQSRMKMIACALRCFFWGKSHMVAPLSVRKHFKISTGVYKNNKKASIALAPTFLTPAQLEKFNKHKKKDDCADAILQGLYWSRIRL